MITAPDFLKWLSVFGVPIGGGGGGDAVTKAQVQTSAFNTASVGGANDAFVVNLSPAVTTLTNGLLVSFNSGALQNLTTSPTLKINALSPVDISTFAGSPHPFDIVPGGTYLFIYNSDLNTFVLLNPTISTADTFIVQQSGYNTAADAGIANAYVATISPVPVGINSGLVVYLLVAHSNTGASTFTLNGNASTIVYSNNTPLLGGELVAGQVAMLLYDFAYSAYILINPANYIRSQQLIWSKNANATINAKVGNGYLLTLGTSQTVDLPTTFKAGDIIGVAGANTNWLTNLGVGTNIQEFGNTYTTSLASTNNTDQIVLIGLIDNTTWGIQAQNTTGFTAS